MGVIVSYEPADLIVTCRAGTSLSELQERLAAADQFLPVWHPRRHVTVRELVDGGYVGLGRRLYGRLRDRILEVRATTPAGRTIKAGAKVVKNVTGFDLPRLYCGAQGRFGTLTEVTLKVHPRAEPLVGIRVRDADAHALLDGVVRARTPVEAFVHRGRAYVFAPGPDPDARELLACFGDAEPADTAFDDLASDPLFAEGVRVAATPSQTPALPIDARSCIIDVSSGGAWTTDRSARRPWGDTQAGAIAERIRARLS